MKHLPAEYVLAMLVRDISDYGPGAMHRRLYDLVRDLIVSGQLAAGTQMPPSRILSEALNVSRHTVSSAMESLTAEGYLVGRQGSGTFVSPHFASRRRLPLSGRAGVANRKAQGPTSGDLSRRGQSLTSGPPTLFQWEGADTLTHGPAPFKIGIPAIDAFPHQEWARCLRQAWRSEGKRMGYQDPTGHRPLKVAISEYLRASRGLPCDPDQIMITSGSQHGLDLAFRLLADPGETIAIEDPGYIGARSAAQASGANVVGVPVDAQGLVVDSLTELADAPRIVFVTPTHQFPTGANLALDRRLALIEWAHQNRGWIVEDDYDSEFRYRGRPYDPLWLLDQGSRVIYTGTFSKVMFPALRLGYMVLPEGLVDSFAAANVVTVIHRPHLEQVALARFMDEGSFARHLRRTAAMHGDRRDALLTAVASDLPDQLSIEPAESGLHVLTRLIADVDDVALSAQARAAGLEPWPLSVHYLSRARHGLLLGFGGSSPAAIVSGVHRLAELLKSHPSQVGST